MTSVGFLKACARRWYVVLAGFLATGVLVALAAGPNVVYFARTTVNILEPDAGKTRIVGFHSADSIAVAHLLSARVNAGVHTPLASNPDVPLYAIGIQEGTHAQVRNIGGQWLSQVTEPVVDIQSVGHDSDEVSRNLRAQATRLSTELAAVEKQLNVPKGQTMELQLNPTDPVVTRVVTQQRRAQAGYGLFGIGLTLVATWAFDRWATRRAAARA